MAGWWTPRPEPTSRKPQTFVWGLCLPQGPSGRAARMGADQNCRLHESMKPVSPRALSFTRRRQVPLAGEPEAFTV